MASRVRSSGRRPEAAGRDHEVGALEAGGERLGHDLEPVGQGGDPPDGHARPRSAPRASSPAFVSRVSPTVSSEPMLSSSAVRSVGGWAGHPPSVARMVAASANRGAAIIARPPGVGSAPGPVHRSPGPGRRTPIGPHGAARPPDAPDARDRPPPGALAAPTDRSRRPGLRAQIGVDARRRACALVMAHIELAKAEPRSSAASSRKLAASSGRRSSSSSFALLLLIIGGSPCSSASGCSARWAGASSTGSSCSSRWPSRASCSASASPGGRIGRAFLLGGLIVGLLVGVVFGLACQPGLRGRSASTAVPASSRASGRSSSAR